MDKLDDNKFAHLLQPIRDLAANWDINIANELEDYLVCYLNFAGTEVAACNFKCRSTQQARSCLHRMFWKASHFPLRVGLTSILQKVPFTLLVWAKPFGLGACNADADGPTNADIPTNAAVQPHF